MKNRKSKRQAWKKPWDFIFTAAGLTIGLGNIWRFPYLCFYNGGGEFFCFYFMKKHQTCDFKPGAVFLQMNNLARDEGMSIF